MKGFEVNRNEQDYYRVDLPPRLFLDGKRRSVMAKTGREALEKGRSPHRQAQEGPRHGPCQSDRRRVPHPPTGDMVNRS